MYYFKLRKGFSLIELLIVIAIVSMIYFLGFEGFSISDISHTKKTPLEYLKLITQQEREGKLICIDDCKTCFFKESLNQPAKKLEEKFNFGNNISIYKFTPEQELQKVEFGRYNDEKICLIVDFYRNGSHSSFVLQNRDKIFFIRPFFDSVKEIDSLKDAKDIIQKDIRALHNGDFY